MKTTDYKVGDAVALNDGNKYIYEGTPYGSRHVYRVIENSEFLLSSDEKGNYAPFTFKQAAEVVKPKKWYNKAFDWWKASNRWKHLVYAIPCGVVLGWEFTVGLAVGMEFKDKLWGGKPDFIDYILTCVGGLIGWGVMRLLGLDYLVMELVKLII